MPRVSFSVPHQLGQEAALQRLKDKADTVKKSFASDVSNAFDRWEGNQLEFGFTTAGMNIKGSMVVEESAVQVNVDVPLVAMMFKGMVERRVRDELGQVLG
jgi:hypothetical protein